MKMLHSLYGSMVLILHFSLYLTPEFARQAAGLISVAAEWRWRTPVCERLNMCENLGSHSSDNLDMSFGMWRRLVR